MPRQVSGPAAALGLLLAVCEAAPGAAASFDCGKVRRADEVAICRDRTLNDEDVRMGVVFQTSLHFLGMGARDAARERQSLWLAQRRRCGSSRVCLRLAYNERLRELQSVMEKAYGLGPL